MNNLTRRGFLGLAGAAGVTGLSACAGTGTSATSDKGGSSNTIEFWSNHPGNSKPVEQQIIQAFQKENPDLTVKLVDAGKNYEEVAQKLNAALVGGQLPDLVVVSDVTWFNFALNKQLAPMDDLLSSAKVDTSDYVDALFNDYKYADGHFALPYARSTPLFYYNKELWSKAGLEDRGPKDWDEFKQWSDALKGAVGSGKHAMELADGSNYLDWYFQNMVWDFGGAYSKEWTPTFSDPNTVKAGQYLQDLAKSGVVKFNATPEADFSAGLAGCILQSTGSLGGISKDAKFEVGTAFLPGTDNCPTGGAGVGIPAKISDERKANAVKFAEFLTNAKNTVTFTQATGYMPVRKSAVDTAEEKAYLEKNPNAKTAIDQLPHTRSQDNARVLLPGGGARIGKALDQVAQGQDVTSVFAGLDKESQQVFDNQIKSKL
ncbi:ABC transporter substrate-binding protein [Phycicoccus sp.]|uniref:ABC transporter substrate-binding protein n=1 Tax=Phycicoccus sp. TaxID=1902410 RepID=UPI002C22DF01|nr:ABC transporter substrate-binding protein [Phycicoccus sp.]HMM94499.1 ABC transporter substrate-binding protein [Phycicoccus sp.]